MKLHSNIIGSGQALLILHGFLGSGDNWKTLAKQFAEHDFEVHLIDQRNHGRSPHTQDFNYDLLVEDLKIYCLDHNIEDSILIGHSMGGKTAMLATTRYPNIFSKLIVVDIAPRAYPQHHQTILEGLSSLDFSVLKSRGDADKHLSIYIEDVGVRLFLLKNLYWVEKGTLGLRVNLRSLIDNIESIGEALPNDAFFDKPALFIDGERSDYITQTDLKDISKHFSNSKVEVISNAGHWVHAENPKSFFKSIMEFIK